MKIILFFIPKNLLSYLVGKIMHISWPSFLREKMIGLFASFYQINIQEAEFPLSHYKSIGDFFVRKLKEGSRPISSSSDWIHPCDSLIRQVDVLQEGVFIQAKNHKYQLQDLLWGYSSEISSSILRSSTGHFDRSLLQSHLDGLFMTYYLCPTDYHRVHAPCAGRVRSVYYIPGTLWPVNNWSVSKVPNLFAVNERVIVNIETESGPCSMVFVGATNVGKITLNFAPEFASNKLHYLGERQYAEHIEYEKEIILNKGDEVGAFHMGSTVVMIYSSQVLRNFETKTKGFQEEAFKRQNEKQNENHKEKQKLGESDLKAWILHLKNKKVKVGEGLFE